MTNPHLCYTVRVWGRDETTEMGQGDTLRCVIVEGSKQVGLGLVYHQESVGYMGRVFLHIACV